MLLIDGNTPTSSPTTPGDGGLSPGLIVAIVFGVLGIVMIMVAVVLIIASLLGWYTTPAARRGRASVGVVALLHEEREEEEMGVKSGRFGSPEA